MLLIKNRWWNFVIVILAIFSLLVGCGRDLGVQDCENVGPQPRLRPFNGIPEVVRVIGERGGLCSGTIVGPRAVLLAGHCIYKIAGPYYVYFKNRKAKMDKWKAKGGRKATDIDDLGVLILADAEDSFKVENKIRVARRVNWGEELRLVGYGCTSLYGRGMRGTGSKRSGFNRTVQRGGFIAFYSPLYKPHCRPVYAENPDVKRLMGPKNTAGLCPGDSGGPALRERITHVTGAPSYTAAEEEGEPKQMATITEYEIVGVASSNVIVSGGKQLISNFVNLGSFIGFLEQVVAEKGIKIWGINA